MIFWHINTIQLQLIKFMLRTEYIVFNKRLTGCGFQHSFYTKKKSTAYTHFMFSFTSFLLYIVCIYIYIYIYITFTTVFVNTNHMKRHTHAVCERRLSAKLVPTFADRGCHVVIMRDPYDCILGFLELEPLLFLSSSSSIILTRLSGSRSRPTTSQKIW
jgi:hypothetical protein